MQARGFLPQQIYCSAALLVVENGCDVQHRHGMNLPYSILVQPFLRFERLDSSKAHTPALDRAVKQSVPQRIDGVIGAARRDFFRARGGINQRSQFAYKGAMFTITTIASSRLLISVSTTYAAFSTRCICGAVATDEDVPIGQCD
jgi:hypothetical protein